MKGPFVRLICRLALITILASSLADAQQRSSEARHVAGVRPSFFAVSVADLDASTAWYRRVLGVEPVREVTSRDGRARARVLRAGALIVELIRYEGSESRSETGGRGQGLFKIGIFVADAVTMHAELLARGVDMDARVMFDEALRLQTFVFRDLDGNRIQVFAPCEDCGGP